MFKLMRSRLPDTCLSHTALISRLLEPQRSVTILRWLDQGKNKKSNLQVQLVRQGLEVDGGSRNLLAIGCVVAVSQMAA